MFGTLEGKREVNSERGFLGIEESGDCIVELWVWSATVENIDEIMGIGRRALSDIIWRRRC